MPRAAISQAASWLRMSPNTRFGTRTLRSIMRNSVVFGVPRSYSFSGGMRSPSA